MRLRKTHRKQIKINYNAQFSTNSMLKDKIIVIKPGPGVDPAKGPGPGFHGSTRVNSGQPGKIKKKLKF
jgi:hypothetical protein